MPTAQDFTAAAALLRVQSEIAQAIETRARNVAAWTGVTAGPYRESAIRGAAATAINASTTATELNDAAIVFDTRAAVCAEYTTAMSIYDDSYDAWKKRVAIYRRNIATEYANWPGNPPTRPADPPAWVTRG